MDRTVRLWDLRAGSPLATSRSHSGLVRCVAADEQLLVSGSSDGNLRAWAAQPRLPHLFDFSAGGGEALLRGHGGPVTSLSLDRDAVYSGRCAARRGACLPACVRAGSLLPPPLWRRGRRRAAGGRRCGRSCLCWC
jgi:WD40 repeat protein